MIKDYIIEKGKIVMHAYSRIVIYSNANGEVHQRIIFCFNEDTPIWL